MWVAYCSGKKKEPKPKLFGPDIFQWSRGLPRERVGGQKARYVPGNQGSQTFWAGWDFAGDMPGVPEKFEKKEFVFNFRFLIVVAFKPRGMHHRICDWLTC